jgi:hypothetical protein
MKKCFVWCFIDVVTESFRDSTTKSFNEILSKEFKNAADSGRPRIKKPTTKKTKQEEAVNDEAGNAEGIDAVVGEDSEVLRREGGGGGGETKIVTIVVDEEGWGDDGQLEENTGWEGEAPGGETAAADEDMWEGGENDTTSFQMNCFTEEELKSATNDEEDAEYEADNSDG